MLIRLAAARCLMDIPRSMQALHGSMVRTDAVLAAASTGTASLYAA
jgi:hypothetical protein